MKTIENLIHIREFNISRDLITKSFEVLNNNWKLKRFALNIGWGLINLVLITYGSLAIIGSPWEIIWFISITMYAACYWILSAKIFDILIGDDIDILKKTY